MPSLNLTKRQYCGSGFTSTTSQYMKTELRLCQRINFRRHSILAAEPPSFQQFLLMYHRPFLGQVQSPAGQFTLDRFQRADVNRRLKLPISSVKVCRRVVIEEHPDQNPIERTDRR